MRSIRFIAMFVLGALLVSCGQDVPPSTSNTDNGPKTLSQPTPAGGDLAPTNGDLVLSGSNGSSPAPPVNVPVDNTMPDIPPGAQYSLLCASFTSPDHIAEAAEFKQAAIARTGMKGWYVYHGDDSSELYYGFYESFNDRTKPDEYARAQADLKKLQNLTDEAGNKIFAQVIFVPITLPDPPANPAWDLKNNKGFWTLQIAIYRDSPLRKQYAVDAVKDARAMGVEAYYHHDPDMSEVFIGSWPKDAVKQGDAAAAESDDPHQNILVLPSMPDKDKQFVDSAGNPVKVLAPAKLDIQDPTLKAAIAQYPYTMVNGEVRGKNLPMKDHTTQFVPYPSYLMQIGDNSAPTNADANTPPDDAGAPGAGAGASEIPGLGGLH